MLEIYKKCEKSLDNPYGIEKIDNIENYDKPFLLCISSQDSVDKSIFGLIKEGARAARVRTSDELAAGYKIDEMPIDFLGLKYEYKNIKDSKSNSLLDDFIYPFLKRGNDIKKQARKINFFCYCNATNVYVELEKRLKEKLLNDGYNEQDIKDILSQISLISIASEIDISNVEATSFLFKDANDTEVYDRLSKEASKQMERNNRNSFIGHINRKDNLLAYIYNGSGKHELKEYFKEAATVKSPLCAAVTSIIENTIKNSKSNELIPLNMKDIKPKVLKYNGEFDKHNTFMTELDNNIDYGNVSKYTKEENTLLSQLDKVYKKLIFTRKCLENETRELEKEKRKNMYLITGIKDKCSDVAFEQIVVSAGMWNGIKDKDYDLMKTDKEIRNEYELMLHMKEEKELNR